MCTFVHTLEREREMGVLSLANEPNEAARGSRRCLFGRALYLPRNESSLCFQAPGRCLLLTRRGIALFPSLCASAASLGPSLSLSLSYSSSSIATTLFLLIFRINSSRVTLVSLIPPTCISKVHHHVGNGCTLCPVAFRVLAAYKGGTWKSIHQPEANGAGPCSLVLIRFTISRFKIKRSRATFSIQDHEVRAARRSGWRP